MENKATINELKKLQGATQKITSKIDGLIGLDGHGTFDIQNNIDFVMTFVVGSDRTEEGIGNAPSTFLKYIKEMEELLLKNFDSTEEERKNNDGIHPIGTKLISKENKDMMLNELSVLEVLVEDLANKIFGFEEVIEPIEMTDEKRKKEKAMTKLLMEKSKAKKDKK